MNVLIHNVEEVAQFLKLISNANRLLILCILAKGEANVGDLEHQLGVSQPALSQHLARMRQEGILETRRSGQQIFYSIKDSKIARILEMMNDLYNEKDYKRAISK